MPSRNTIVNGIIFVSVIPVLVGLHFLLPESVHNTLVFDHSRFSLYTLWTSAWMHIDNKHLFNNVAGYSLGIAVVWYIFAAKNRQRSLRRIFIVVLSVFPIMISLTSYVILQFGLHATEAITRGFSGINSSILGLLYISVLELTYDHRRWRGVYGLGLGIVLLTMISMAHRANVLDWKIVVIGTVGTILCLSYLIPRDLWNLEDIKKRLRENFSDFAIVFYGAFVLVLVLPRIFPLNWVRDGQIINIFGHLAGLVYGLIVGAISIWYLRNATKSYNQSVEKS